VGALFLADCSKMLLTLESCFATLILNTDKLRENNENKNTTYCCCALCSGHRHLGGAGVFGQCSRLRECYHSGRLFNDPNPLNNTDGNTLNNLIPQAEIGTTVYRFSTEAGFEPSTFIADWNPNFDMNPGEGVFIQVGSETTLTFVGEVMQGTLENNMPAGLSIKGSMVPAEESLDDVGFPAELGDTVFLFRDGDYVPSTYIASFNPPAVPKVGEAFWVQRANEATWTREFNVNQ
jgi:hypothetical protein